MARESSVVRDQRKLARVVVLALFSPSRERGWGAGVFCQKVGLDPPHKGDRNSTYRHLFA
jgi:hypothetical protein